MRVVRHGEGYARLVVYAQYARGGGLLVADAVALYLEVEVLAEDPAQLEGPRLRGLVLAVHYLLRYVAREAAGEADEALRVLAQQSASLCAA